jgi:hypothetical protein
MLDKEVTIENTGADLDTMNERLGALLDMDTWTMDEAIELSALFFVVAYLTDDDEAAEDDDDESEDSHV